MCLFPVVGLSFEIRWDSPQHKTDPWTCNVMAERVCVMSLLSDTTHHILSAACNFAFTDRMMFIEHSLALIIPQTESVCSRAKFKRQPDPPWHHQWCRVVHSCVGVYAEVCTACACIHCGHVTLETWPVLLNEKRLLNSLLLHLQAWESTCSQPREISQNIWAEYSITNFFFFFFNF